ncbi:MAG: uracil-DNA glycosylase [Candidatus Kerfeldbacteria bacterium CG15_BIG_FIL_POST_REV_8_21_14_020_45_12]|uniref:Uracil-DNA glycosylase n=1 Tax=Candidatus Kerfeldbacteria bacterium CG15_BIG_FIL_POST_REV_8_21_14_020_45_12 TaxID=2014247 RepID=A0A2M7H315_9BACT|nr:MAG: uracil-DNA glycosylase [Candidatus Kerfeldbacteria bacterium CG15_BIG_FIL_POST_REV_8_21_14_020_45_12]PJA93346.1 MAG: uracil-DNA glycosylase [Candidatus Kerfeldbacteria bacterium CG_4_9_14_3_um_filter_45_8]
MEVRIENSWKEKLADEFLSPYFDTLRKFVHKEYTSGEIVYPRPQQIFSAFDHCPFDKVKVVILGQDPYHGPGQANGLCFSVAPTVTPPPSLKNIFQELSSDCGCGLPVSGDLTPWADQGVLLLNSTLTVRGGQAGSHQGKGWEEFTDAVVRALSEQREHLVFILWGRYAQQKGAQIDRSKHCIVESPHPSPFSAYSGFFGSRPFSRANKYLLEHKLSQINWCL